MAFLLGDFLIQKKLLKKDQLSLALEDQKGTREFLGEILVRKGFISEEDLLKALSEQFNLPSVDLRRQNIDWAVASRFTASLVIDHDCLPFRQDDLGLTVAIVNPLDAQAVSMVEEQIKGVRVRLVLASQSDMREVLKVYRKHNALHIKKLLEGGA
jgi:type IV pilus assembly protein PilB